MHRFVSFERGNGGRKETIKLIKYRSWFWCGRKQVLSKLYNSYKGLNSLFYY